MEGLEKFYSIQDRWLNDYHGTHNFDLLNPQSAARVRRAYYALVTYIDRKLGELLASLEENGLKEDTVIIFTSDHGDMLCEKGMVQKRTFYEWSARVPLIITFPDKTGSGKKIRTPVSLIDLLPTITDLASVKERLPCDGESLMPLINDAETEEREVFAEIHSEGIYGNCFMIRRGKYKYNLVHNLDEQLFDLESDPDEWINLASDDAYVEVKENLKARILATFDPQAIEKEVAADIRRRRIIRAAMNANDTKWDVSPVFDGRRGIIEQYLP